VALIQRVRRAATGQSSSVATPRSFGRLGHAESWIARGRVIAVPFAVGELVGEWTSYPAADLPYAVVLTAVFAVGAVALWVARRRLVEARAQAWLGVAALSFDVMVVSAYVTLYAFDPGTPVRFLLLLPVLEAALRYGTRAGVLVPLASIPPLVAFEWRRPGVGDLSDIQVTHILTPLALQVLVGLVIGLLTERRAGE
jgi:hypothetical protein